MWKCLTLATLIALTPVASYAATHVGTVVRVTDGDTIVVHMHHCSCTEKIRLRHIDTPENNTFQGRRVTQIVKGFLPQGSRVRIHTDWKRGKYKRLLADVEINRIGDLGKYLLFHRYAVPYR